MNSKSALVHLHLVDYAPQGDVFKTDTLPEITALFDPAKMAIKVMPAAGTIDELTTNPPTEPGTWRVIFYDRAEQAVENALLAGTLPRKALAKWQQEMKALLGFHRKQRRSVLLVDRAAVCRGPKSFANELSTYLGIDAPKIANQQAAPNASASVETVIAAQTVAQSLRARRLNGELDASSLPMPEEVEAHPCDVDAAFQAYVAGVDRASVDGLKAENDLLLMQLGNVQEELESYFKRCSVQKQQISDLENQMQMSRKNTAQADAALLALREDLDRELKQHKTLTETAKTENELLLMQLGNVQEELESYFLEAGQLKETSLKQEQQLAMLGNESSVATLDAKGLSNQLHDTERKLQDARDTLRDTEGEMQDVAGHLHTTEDNLKEREHNLEQAQRNVAQLETQLHQREDELHRFLRSTSWRVTGPLRRMKDRLARSKGREH